VSNPRLEKESGFGIVKVKALLSELERNGYIKRVQEMSRNLKSKRHIQCLRHVSPVVQNPSNRPGGTVFGTTEKRPLSLPSQSHPSPIQEQEKSSLPLPDQKLPERLM